MSSVNFIHLFAKKKEVTNVTSIPFANMQFFNRIISNNVEFPYDPTKPIYMNNNNCFLFKEDSGFIVATADLYVYLECNSFVGITYNKSWKRIKALFPEIKGVSKKEFISNICSAYKVEVSYSSNSSIVFKQG